MTSALEREARRRKVPVSVTLNLAVREWLKKSALEVSGDEAQRELHAVAEKYIGALKGHDKQGAATVRETIRKRLRQRILDFPQKADSSRRSE